MKSRSNAQETECSCNHLTHFAVLFDYSDANSGVRCTTKITEPWNGLEFLYIDHFTLQSTDNNTKESGRVNRKCGSGPCTKSELNHRSGNFCINL